ncbi:MAG: sigma-70 family RNA polymerase sigma factor [Saprospiraceae bacterium]|nr:sigma-70 family RNA polymerase sigma factor [Saprospiraceae bacterium]
MADEELVSEYLLTQNGRYFEILYQRYSGKVYAKCLTILNDNFLAMDAMQDIFMKVMLSISTFKSKAKFSTWLYSITYNFCIDETRRRKKRMMAGEEEIEKLTDTLEDEDLIEDERLISVKVDHMKEILGEMKEIDKSMLLMKYQDDLSIKEIVDITNKTESAVKMQLKRAKEKFVKIHEEKYANEQQ